MELYISPDQEKQITVSGIKKDITIILPVQRISDSKSK